jgi:hypothetical protein
MEFTINYFDGIASSIHEAFHTACLRRNPEVLLMNPDDFEELKRGRFVNFDERGTTGCKIIGMLVFTDPVHIKKGTFKII